MPNVVRFTLSTARNLDVSGAGSFINGVLDVDANNIAHVARVRFLVQPYRAVEVGIVDSATPPPALPAVPGAPNPDPYPQYVTDADLSNPAFGARGRTFLGRSLQPVVNRFPLLVAGLLSDGVQTDCNTWVKYTVVRATEALTLVFSNQTDGTSAANANNVTYRAAVKVNGSMIPVFFNGRRDAIVEPDGLVFADAIGVPLAAGAVVEVHTRVLVSTAGEKWVANVLTDNTIGEGVLNGTTGADLTTNGTVTPSRAYGVMPLAVLAAPLLGTARTLVGVGDSIMQQSKDTDGGVSGVITFGWGFARRYCHANSLPFVNMGLGGDTAQGWVSTGGRKYAHRQKLTADAGALICNFGRNDLDAGRTLAQIQADLIALWTSYARLGIPVWQATVPPRTNSTDGWVTTANQTVRADNSIRVALNDWIRTNPTPLTGYVETADTLETARNSGIWKAGWTLDGIHPEAVGHAAMKGALDATTLAASLFA